MVPFALVPIYYDIPDDFDFTDMSVLPRMKTDPELGARVLVAYTTAFYQDTTKEDKELCCFSFNVQWVACL